MKWLVILMCCLAAASALTKCCPQPESEGKCDCCPDACCCLCSNVTIPGGTAMPTMTPPGQTTTTSEVCELFGLDVVIAVDGSSSVTASGWEVAMQFLADVVASTIWLEVGVKTKFAFVHYSSASTIVWELDDSQTESVMSLQDGFLNEPFPTGFTFTGAGLNDAGDILEFRDRDDDLYPDFVFVLSDGKTNEGPDVFEQAVERIQALTDLVYVVGIGGDVDQDELEFIAGGPDNVFLVEDGFGALGALLEDIISTVLVRLCDSISPPPTTTPEPQMTTTGPPQVVETCKCCCPPLPKKKDSCGCY